MFDDSFSPRGKSTDNAIHIYRDGAMSRIRSRSGKIRKTEETPCRFYQSHASRVINTVIWEKETTNPLDRVLLRENSQIFHAGDDIGAPCIRPPYNKHRIHTWERMRAHKPTLNTRIVEIINKNILKRIRSKVGPLASRRVWLLS